MHSFTMHSSSPSHCSPSTPACLRNPLQFRPSNSSPLAESPSASSPVIAAQARRRSQYKPRSPQTPTTTSRRGSGNYSDGNRPLTSRSISAYSVGIPENPPKLSMRDKFRARCFERAVKAREKVIKGRRYVAHSHHLSSDDQAMDDDESEDEEDIMQDELFRRIMENTNRRQLHTYRVSYANEVGSSFDPNLEDAEAWEREFAAPVRPTPPMRTPTTRVSMSTPPRLHATRMEQEEITPFDLEDAELEEYAEECARKAAMADFDDLLEEDIFAWSDIEDLTGEMGNEEDGMDVS